MAFDIERLTKWIGRFESRSDQITPGPLAGLATTLDRNEPYPAVGDPLPPLWHWLFFLPTNRLSEIGEDGHAKRGGLLPPVPMRCRMFAGARLKFHDQFRVGDVISRRSHVLDVNYKEGRTGPLVFVKVHHKIRNSNGAEIIEEDDIVYRDCPLLREAGQPRQSVPANASWSREIRPNEVLLFRYSALTFNGHRIHYDRRFATEVEGYPGLVVHGPLIATFLMDLLRSNLLGVSVSCFDFRAILPIFDLAPFVISGRVEPGGTSVKLWTSDFEGALAMNATATLI
jgi:3-methylfumaryl-CoA hydratase